MSTFDNAPPPADWKPEARPDPFATAVELTMPDCVLGEN